MVVVAIVGVTAALAYDGLRRARPRATFDGVAAELQSLVHQARQQALMAGVPVAVLVFPNFPQPSTGRIVVVQDVPAQSIQSASSALRLDTYNPAVLAAPP